MACFFTNLRFGSIFYLLLFLIVSCGPKKVVNESSGKTKAEEKTSKKSPKVALFLDYTSSMRGFYKVGDISQNIGKLINLTQDKGAAIEFWKYGRIDAKSNGHVCLQIPASETQNVNDFLDDSKFNWIANDYVVAIDRMVQLSLADKEKVSVLLTDGIPSEIGNKEIDGGDHSSMQINITNRLSKFAANPNSACTILSLGGQFDGTSFYADGNKANYKGSRPYFLVLIYDKEQSELVKSICNTLSGVTASYSYNNEKLGFYELSSGKIAANAKNNKGFRFIFLAQQSLLGAPREQFNTSMVTIAKSSSPKESLQASWTTKPLPNNKVLEVSAPVMEDLDNCQGQEFIITYKAPKPFGILSKGFDSDQATKESLTDPSHKLENSSARDLNILIDGIYEAFSSKPGAIHKFTAPKKLSE